MLTETDVELLLTYAEVAAAFVGFSAIAGIIGGRSTEIDQQASGRLRTVIMGSVLILIAAFAPLLFARFGVENIWRACSILLLPLNWLVAYLVTVLEIKHQLGMADKVYAWVAHTLEVPIQIFLILNVLGLFSAFAAPFYLAFIFLAILQLAGSLAMVIHSLLSHVQNSENVGPP